MANTDAVDELVKHFRTRLLLKRYRPDAYPAAPLPGGVAACEAAFRQLAERAVMQAAAGVPLDAVAWAAACEGFSEEWIDFCHWVSPRRFREHLCEALGVRWVGIGDVPRERELPPVNLKLYKSDAHLIQPYTCPCCALECNSLAQYLGHARGRQHKAKAQEWSDLRGGAPVEPVIRYNKPTSPRMALELKRAKQRLEQSLDEGTPRRAHRLSVAPSADSSDETLMDASSGNIGSNRSEPLVGCDYTGNAGVATPYFAQPAAVLRVEVVEAAPPRGVVGIPDLAEAPLDAATRQTLQQLDGALARFVSRGGAAAFDRATALAAAVVHSAAGEHAAHALVDAAATGAGDVADVAAQLALTSAGFQADLEAVVARLADRGAEEAAAGDDVDVFNATRARARRTALVRFAGTLVGAGALPPALLVRCIAVALQGAAPDCVADACKVVTKQGVARQLEAAGAGPTVAHLFTSAVRGRHCPRYVRVMVAQCLAASA